VHFALKSTPSKIRRRAEFLHLVRTECALVQPMKNAITCYKRDFRRIEYNMKNIKIKKNIDQIKILIYLIF